MNFDANSGKLVRSASKIHSISKKSKKIRWVDRKNKIRQSWVAKIFENFPKFRKFWKKSKNFKNFRDSTLTNFNFRSSPRIFLIFLYASKWIFEADSNLLSEMTAKFTGKSYFMFTIFWTVKDRNYIKTVKSLFGFVK